MATRFPRRSLFQLAGAAALLRTRLAGQQAPPRPPMAEPPARGAPLMRIRALQKNFGEHAVLRGIDLDVMPGDRMAILGASGSGKSTLLRCLNFMSTVAAMPGTRYSVCRKRERFGKSSMRLRLHLKCPKYTASKRKSVVKSRQ